MEAVLDELRLLRRREFRALFPKSWIQVERLIGFPKSYIAIKLPGNSRKRSKNHLRRRALSFAIHLSPALAPIL
jgi:hypothetical protein